MQKLDEYCFDVASGLSPGNRDRQEDAVIADFPLGAPFGFAVLSDGMGGHASGDVASGIVVTEIFSDLKLQSHDPVQLEQNIGWILRNAMDGANRCIELFTMENPESSGMGATLVAPVLFGTRLYWISVGDSPLFLFRDDKLIRLNEDHSYGAKIDALRAQGKIASDEASNHPDRNCLTSVLGGQDITQVDCRSEPLALKEGDVVLASSDGLQTLFDEEIAALLRRHKDRPSNVVGDALLEAIGDVNCPDQDNISFCLIRVAKRERVASSLASEPVQPALQPHESGAEKQGQIVRIDRRNREGAVYTMVRVSGKAGRG